MLVLIILNIAHIYETTSSLKKALCCTTKVFLVGKILFVFILLQQPSRSVKYVYVICLLLATKELPSRLQ